MSESETEIMFAIRAALGQRGAALWRNNVGFDRERRVHYGLGLGSPDLVGIQTVTVTPEHLGQRLGVFLGVEVKTPKGRVSDDQKRWHAVAAERGALVVVARSVDEALSLTGLEPGLVP